MLARVAWLVPLSLAAAMTATTAAAQAREPTCSSRLTADGLREPDWECLERRDRGDDATAGSRADRDGRPAADPASPTSASPPSVHDLIVPDWARFEIVARARSGSRARAHEPPLVPAAGDECPSRRVGDLMHPDWSCLERRAERPRH